MLISADDFVMSGLRRYCLPWIFLFLLFLRHFAHSSIFFLREVACARASGASVAQPPPVCLKESKEKEE